MERRPQQDATDSATAPTAPPTPTSSVSRDAPDRGARANARAYLDLWERHVVQTALYGPDAPWRPTKS